MDGNFLVTAGEENAVNIVDIKSGKPIEAFRVPGGAIASIKFSPDRKELACEGVRGEVKWTPLIGQKSCRP
jgi:hypothetical protein